jgi:hypothetical protein
MGKALPTEKLLSDSELSNFKTYQLDKLAQLFRDNDFIYVNADNKFTWRADLTKQNRIDLWKSEDKSVYIGQKQVTDQKIGEKKIIDDIFKMVKEYEYIKEKQRNGVQLFLKDIENFYCVDIDDHKYSSGEIMTGLFKDYPFLKYCPFTLSRTNKLPHFYLYIQGLPKYRKETGIMKNNKAIDLLKQKSVIERTNEDSYIYYNHNLDFEFPTYQWEDIKEHFNIEEMNIEEIHSSNSYDSFSSIPSSPKSSNTEGTFDDDEKNKIFDIALLCAHEGQFLDYDDWIKFFFVMKNENLFDIFDRISEISGQIKYEKEGKNNYGGTNDSMKFWTSTKMTAKDKKLTIATLHFWAKQKNLKEYNKIIKKYTKCLIQDEEEQQEKDESYEGIKAEFEKNHFKVRYPLSFYEEINNKVNYYSKKDFVDLNMNSYIYHKKNKNGEIEKLPIVNDWLKDPKIREYDEMNFIPYGPNEEATQNNKIYNTFSGYNIQKHNFTDKDLIDVQQFKDYLYAVAGESQENYEYLYRWLARIIKHPRHKTNTCILIKSPQGTGKGTLQEFMKAILGTKYAEQYCGTDILVEKFNGVLENKLFVAIDEGSSNNYNHSGKMKNRITEPTIEIEEKGIKKRIVNNLMNIMIVTNDDIVVKIEESDRRYVMLKASSKYINNTSFFGKLKDNFLNNPIGLYSVYKWFLNCDVDEKYDFQNNRPITNDYKAVQALNIPIIALFFQDLLETFNDKNKIEESKDKTYHFIRCIDLFTYYKNYCKEAGFKIEPTLSRFGLDIINHTPFINKMKKEVGIVYSFKIEDIKNALRKYQPKCLIEDDEE